MTQQTLNLGFSGKTVVITGGSSGMGASGQSVLGCADRREGRTPDEMANMIVFRASDAASYITGQTIAVNGGPSLGGIQLN
jgi:NAD(P)-dependent dehydrogenase (short-subunit alcohol dehydrogenase family)